MIVGDPKSVFKEIQAPFAEPLVDQMVRTSPVYLVVHMREKESIMSSLRFVVVPYGLGILLPYVTIMVVFDLRWALVLRWWDEIASEQELFDMAQDYLTSHDPSLKLIPVSESSEVVFVRVSHFR